MIDLHTHILPAIDDGAQNVEASLSLLREEVRQQVTQIALTPHFYPHKDTLDAFLEKRNASVLVLQEHYTDSAPIDIRLGAEVHYSPNLMQTDLHSLTLGRSNYLLLELSTRHYPAHVNQFMDHLSGLGITPILAHVERCVYFREDSSLLCNLIDRGAIGQLNAENVLSKDDKGFSIACLEHGLASIIASDTHNLAKRPPRLAEAMQRLSPELNSAVLEATQAIWDNQMPPLLMPTPVKKGLFGSYR